MHFVILGDGPMGRALAEAATEAGHAVSCRGRPPSGRHPPAAFDRADVAFEFSTAAAVRSNVADALAAGCRRLVIGTTGWDRERTAVARAVGEAGASAVAAPSFSPAVAIFLALAADAARRFGASVPDYDPYLVEWHRAAKRDRPSGTALEVARRVIAAHPAKGRVAAAGAEGPARPDELAVLSLRAGSSPGEHVLGFDGPGETLELRVTARSRRAYADGALLAADWLVAAPRPPGVHAFTDILDIPSGDLR